MRQKDKNKHSRKKLSLLKKGLIYLAIGIAVLSGYSIAQYISLEEEEPLYVAKSFYFESDMLSEGTNGVYPLYVLQAGVDDIAFTLMNYPDELRVSEVKIEGEVVLESSEHSSVKIDLTGKQKKEQKIVFENVKPGTYVVTAKAEKPYVKTLGARFTVIGLNTDLEYSVNDAEGSPNLIVKVATTDYEGNVLIEWPNGVVPDNTDPLLKDAKGNSFTMGMEKNSEYTFQFFKTNPSANYVNNIKVDKVNS